MASTLFLVVQLANQTQSVTPSGHIYPPRAQTSPYMSSGYRATLVYPATLWQTWKPSRAPLSPSPPFQSTWLRRRLRSGGQGNRSSIPASSRSTLSHTPHPYRRGQSAVPLETRLVQKRVYYRRSAENGPLSASG